MTRPRHWQGLLNKPQTQAELTSLRHSVTRAAPFGQADWVKRVVRDLALESGKGNKHE